MCCGKAKQGTNGKKDTCACGAYALNFALMAMLNGSCATQNEILSDIYQHIKFDSTHPFGKKKDEEYSDPRKMCKWVKANMKTINAKLYVNSNASTETSNPVLAGFWRAAGFDAKDYTTGEGITLLGKQGATPAVTAVCAFAWFGGPTPPGGGMHFVAIKDEGGTTYACDPYHGKWFATKKPSYKTLIETKPGSSLMYIGIAVVLTK